MTLEKRQPNSDSASGSFHLSISQPRTLFRVATTGPLRPHTALLNGYESALRVTRLPETTKPSILRHDTQGSVADHHEGKESHGSYSDGPDSPKADKDTDVNHADADLLIPRPVTVNGETYEYLPICGIPESLKTFIHDQESTQMAAANILSSTASSLEPRTKEVIIIELDDDEVVKPKSILGKRKASDDNKSSEPAKCAANNSLRASTQSTITGTQHYPVELD